MSTATLPAPVETPAPVDPPDIVHIVDITDDEIGRWLCGDPTVIPVALCGWVAPRTAAIHFGDKPECPECARLNMEGL